LVLASFGAQIVETWTLPWSEFRVPHYPTGRVGAWELKRQFQPVLRGVFRGLQTAAENYLLTKDGRVSMSLSPIEIESLAPYVPRMRGHVVIAGLGMGLALYNALLRPAVRGVTVVERDPDVIALFGRSGIAIGPAPTASRSSRPKPSCGRLPSRSTTSTPISGTSSVPPKPPPTRVRCAAICGRNRPGTGAWRPISSRFWLAAGANRR
jgi:hypothetical protein